MSDSIPRVFISYSHDSPSHSARVLAFAQTLRSHGVDVELDQFHTEDIIDWPRWCNEQISRERSDFVLCICTAEYERRIAGNVPPEKGKGVYWEGSLLDDDIYDAKGNRRLIPVLFDDEPDSAIPRFLRGWTFCRLREFALTDPGYEQVIRILTGQARIVKNRLGSIPVLPPVPPPDLSPGHLPPHALPKIELSKLPQTSREFLGREAELKLLDDAWSETGRTHVVVLVAAGGVGKTSLVKRWLDRLKADGWRGAQRVYGWSFFSQGTSEDHQASDDPFLTDALRRFAVEYDPKLSSWDKGRLLAGAVARSRTLLVLDGLEPLQHPPGPLGGELRAPGVQSLLRQLVAAGHPGLGVVTTRETIKDLEEHERTRDHPAGAVLKHGLDNLSEADGARLLHRLGVRRAGAADISENDVELRQASREVHGHALTLTLLGRYLAHSADDGVGDIRQRDRVKLHEADTEALGGHAFKVMEAYEKWFASSGEKGARELATVRLLGFFDRPADAACLAALRAEPAIVGLTEPLVGLSAGQWNITLKRLEECGLIEPRQGRSVTDTHPLVREYFAKRLREQHPEAWQEGHRRLYEHLKASVPHWPEGAEGLQPLYQAVAHGCLAGMHQQACEEVYRDCILRGTTEFYSTKKLGLFGSDLGAVVCFFEKPWSRPAPALSEAAQAWLINQAAFRLRALGRLSEALEPMRAYVDAEARNERWENAAVGASNLSELELTLGDVPGAVREGAQSVNYVDRSEDAFQRMVNRTTHANALHRAGQRAEVLALFREAESMQAEHQPNYPLLYSLRGFGYCDLLLAEAERAAWRVMLTPSPLTGEGGGEEVTVCRDVEQRAVQTLAWAQQHLGPLDIALDHLTLGRAALYRAILEHSSLDMCRSSLDQAVDGLRASGDQIWITAGLISRAWLRFVEGDADGARADLDAAWQIAERGAMKLHLADIHLHRARLFRDRAELAKARQLIEQCGYGRRKEELEDVERALGGQRS